jgi:hypothetical protein
MARRHSERTYSRLPGEGGRAYVEPSTKYSFHTLHPVLKGCLLVSQRARVQREESATARCASTGNRQAPIPTAYGVGWVSGVGTDSFLAQFVAVTQSFISGRTAKSRMMTNAPPRGLLVQT